MKTLLQIASSVRRMRTAWSAALFCLLSFPASSATYTWTGEGWFGQDYLWSNDFNWAGGVAPSSGEANVTIVFPNDGSPKVTTNDIVGLSVASIQFQGVNYVVHGKPAGNTLGLYSGGLAGWNVAASGNGNYFASTCPLILSNTGVINVSSGCTLSVLSSVGGAGGITKVNSGALKFAAGTANTYAGTTTVSDGTLDLNNGVLFPSVTSYVSMPGSLVIGGTNMAYSPRVRLLFDNQIANTAPIRVNENGLLALNGHDDVLGPVTLSGGVIDTEVLSGPSAPGTWTLNSNVTNLLSASGVEARISGQLYLGAFSRTFRVETDSQLKIDAGIGDSPAFDPGFSKTGGGLLVLSNAMSTYNGPTLIEEGTLRLQGSNTMLGATSAGTIVSTNAQLELDNAQIGLEALTLNGAQKAPLEFMSAKWNSWAGPVTLNGRCVVVGWDETIISHGLEISGAIGGSGLLYKAGDGTLKLSGAGANTFSGGLTVEKGWIVMEKLGNVPALSGPLIVGVTNANHPTSSYVSVSDWNQIPDNLPVTIHHTAQVYVQPGVVEVLGHLTLAGGFVQNWGFLSLSGNITNLAELTDDGYANSYIYGNVELSPGSHVLLCNHSVTRLILDGVISGGGGITKTGPGRLELRGTNTYSGLTWIQDGTLELIDGARPGSAAAGTIVEAEAQLNLNETSVTNEALTVKGGLPASPYSVSVNGASGTNRWRGPVTLEGAARFRTSRHLILDGPISGPGAFIYVNTPGSGPGKIEFAGSSANTYAGVTTVEGGTLLLNKSGVVAVAGDLNITGTTNLWFGTNIWSAVRLMQPNQIADASAVTVASVHSLLLDGNAETIGLLTGDGKVELGSATLTTGGKASSSFAGLITGSGGLTKVGSRTFTLWGDNTYTGLTSVTDGVLMVFGQQPGSTVTVLNGARLGGTGRVGNGSAFNGAAVSPGASPGVLESGTFNLIGTSAELQIEINGPTAGIAYDQLKVTGGVSLMGGALKLTMNFPGVLNNQYVIISNDGADAVSGTFTDLPEGVMLTNNGAVFQITYHGGDGNDVVLVQQAPGFGSQITSISRAGGSLQLEAMGVANATYSVQASTNLTPPAAWTIIGSATADPAGLVQFTDTNAVLHAMRFYRLRYP